jgi:hypothetical protein
MRKPTNFDFRIVHAWMENAGAFWAWERLQEMIENDRLRAWRMVQVMVACAPDRGLLGYVAAGPVEDLTLGDVVKPLMRQEAERNARFRICLGMANALPEELERLADRQTKELPAATAIQATQDEVALMVAYFHGSDTSWAPTFLEELTRNQPSEALFILRLLVAADEYPHVRDSVFLHAFDAFIRLNFATYREELKSLALQYDDLRRWCLSRKYCPTDDAESWSAFLQDLS